MAPKAKRSMKKVGAMSKQSVSIDMVKEAVTALGDRNGSTIKSILNYLMRNKNVKPSSRTLVILAIGRAVRTGVLAKKLPNTFAVRSGSAKTVTAVKSRKRKAKRSKKRSVKSSTKRRRRSRKRKTVKKRSRKSSKKSRSRRRKSAKKSKVRRSRKIKKSTVQPPVRSKSRRPVRRATRGINYRV